MSTFLELVQKVNLLSGAQGTVTSLSTVSGYQATLKELVKSAWTDIQGLRPDYNFLKRNVQIATVAGQTEYVMPTDTQSVRYVLDSDSKALTTVSEDYYIFNDISSDTQAKPKLFFYDRDVNYTLTINPPDTAYNLDVYYLRKPQELENNSDVPICPTEFHDAIVYRACVDVGVYFGNTNLYQGFLAKSDSRIGSLMRSQIPAKKIRNRGIA